MVADLYCSCCCLWLFFSSWSIVAEDGGRRGGVHQIGFG
jgi:hypothetical protein